MTKHIYAAHPDNHDKSKDFLYSVHLPAEQLAVLPPSGNLSHRPQPSIYDQGDIGSCVDNAGCALLGFVEAKEGNSVELFSRLFAYFMARGGVPQDEGSTLFDFMAGIKRKGICVETDWPYDTTKVFDVPPAAAFANAKPREAGLTYYRLSTLSDMKTCITQNYPFFFGISVYESFESPGPNAEGMIPMPNTAKEQLLGGHALTCMGYDDSKQALYFRNSWGTDWALSGWAWLPYAYVQNANLFSDCWTIRKIAK
jgi:C1A family cysteine protease